MPVSGRVSGTRRRRGAGDAPRCLLAQRASIGRIRAETPPGIRPDAFAPTHALDPPIGTESPDPPRPRSFERFGLREEILRALEELGFRVPRPIQADSLPMALAGKDVLGLAQTGTGKTAAFVLPILQRLLSDPGEGPRALIVAPTRELAQQIHTSIRELCCFTELRSMTLYGGVGTAPQIRELKKSPDILVVCPGRLLDLARTGDVPLDGIEVLVLDEADQMLDMGFLPDITAILERLPAERQNLLFSATMPSAIRALADQVLRDPLVVEGAHETPLETIQHSVYPVDTRNKTALLVHLIGGRGFRSAIVFVRTKQRAKELSEELVRAKVEAVALHGDLGQPQRQRAMHGFRDGHYKVLVATDIAARGLDVENVSHVINYDLPASAEAYTHRIGRTGRSRRRGRAVTFVTHVDFPGLKAIERKLHLAIPRIKLRDMPWARGASDSRDGRDRRSRGGGRAGGRKRGPRSGPGSGNSGGSGRNGGSGKRGRGGSSRR